jgi:hypothetical protein
MWKSGNQSTWKQHTPLGCINHFKIGQNLWRLRPSQGFTVSVRRLSPLGVLDWFVLRNRPKGNLSAVAVRIQARNVARSRWPMVATWRRCHSGEASRSRVRSEVSRCCIDRLARLRPRGRRSAWREAMKGAANEEAMVTLCRAGGRARPEPHHRARGDGEPVDMRRTALPALARRRSRKAPREAPALIGGLAGFGRR